MDARKTTSAWYVYPTATDVGYWSKPGEFIATSSVRCEASDFGNGALYPKSPAEPSDVPDENPAMYSVPACTASGDASAASRQPVTGPDGSTAVARLTPSVVHTDTVRGEIAGVLSPPQ